MNLIEFFGTVIKPKKTKNKQMFHPTPTSRLNEKLAFIRDKDVNAFLIKSKTGYIAIDTGYKNSINMYKGLNKLNINRNDIHTVLLTHLDLDHAGGVDTRCHILYPKAKIYLGYEEEKYLNKTYARKKVLGIKLASPIKLDKYNLLFDNQILEIDGISIRVIHTPGHTLGHLSFLLDKKYLFTGDSLILDEHGVGYCFWDFWNIDSKLNKKSLERLKEIANENKVDYILTSHNGFTSNIEKAFQHIDTYINWNKHGFIFDKDAPKDPYHDQDKKI